MVDYNNLEFRRMIMHTIHAKEDSWDSARASYSDELLENDDHVNQLIRRRLIDAAGKSSKAFEMEFGDTNADSCYALCQELQNADNNGFINISQQAADRLAATQTRSNIPGGYLLVIDGADEITGLCVHIFIKAEPHEALLQQGDAQITIVRNVFLSPSQKLYKIGIIYQKENPASQEPNDLYGCFLFDDQFRQTQHPAEYFYRDFLGFTAGNNSKIQSQNFYEKTAAFIKTNIEDLDRKQDLLRALRLEFTTNQEPTINPDDFGARYFRNTPLHGRYQEEISHDLPTSIAKDATLIQNKLSKRKIDFPHNINITGPEDEFDERVQILTEDDRAEIDLEDTSVTYLRITGRPYSNE